MRFLLEKNWLVKKIVRGRLSAAAGKYARGGLIDIGCGEMPYREIFSPYIDAYQGLDIKTTETTPEGLILGRADAVPCPDDNFDTLLCTAVLEHLEEPDKAIAESYRILRPGGYAIYTVPLFWHIHDEPKDFYRFTEYGLKFLFEKNSFQAVEIEPLSGFWVTFGQESIYYMDRLRKGAVLDLLVSLIATFIQLSCFFINKLDNSKGFSWMYLVVAKKVI